MVQSACCYHFLLRFESFSKMEGYEGFLTRWIWWSILTFFTIFDISLLWMDKFGWNWWPNWRVFDALTESGKIFDRYDPQNFWETLEAGANSCKSVTWSAVPDAPMLVYVGMRWWEGQRPRRGRWPMISHRTIFSGLRSWFGGLRGLILALKGLN